MNALVRIPFNEALLPKVQAFDCGSEIWQTEVSDWIKKPRGSDGALNDIENGGLAVWLYATSDGNLVGFGSLGESMQSWPQSKDPPIQMTAIPFMAVDRKFWGQPAGPWEDRYATQIVRNLVAEACKFLTNRPILKLLVYEGNEKAIRLYERIGFKEYQKPRKDPTNGLLYKRMALDLSIVPNMPDQSAGS